MWTYETHLGLAKILYESLTGKFLAYFNAECIGRYLTPQRAAGAISRVLAAEPSERKPEIPTDLSFWTVHHQVELEAERLGTFNEI